MKNKPRIKEMILSFLNSVGSRKKSNNLLIGVVQTKPRLTIRKHIKFSASEKVANSHIIRSRAMDLRLRVLSLIRQSFSIL